jgi:hypothetical protein
MPRTARRQGERGAATLESVGVTIVASLIVTSLLLAVLPQARILRETMAYYICQVVTFGQGGCTPPSSLAEAHEPTEPCVVSQNGVERNQEIAIIVVTTSDGRRIEIQQLSNGEYQVTVTDTTGAGAEVGVGGGLSLTVNDTTVGGLAVADAGASLDIADGQVYVTDEDGIGGLMDALVQDQVLDTVAGESGPIRWVTDAAAGLVGADNGLPAPDAVIAEGGISLNASAEATGLTDSASVGVGESVVLGVKEDKDGTTTVYVTATVEGEAGLQTLGVDTEGNPEFQGAALEGSIEVVNAVTFDPEGNMTSLQVTTATSGEASGYATALFGGDGDASLNDSLTDTTIHQATLPITDDYSQSVVSSYLINMGIASVGGWTNPLATVNAAASAQGFFDAAGDYGTITELDYDTDSTTVFGFDGSAELGIQVGASGSVEEDSMEVVDAQYWDGTQWVEWEACSA